MGGVNFESSGEQLPIRLPRVIPCEIGCQLPEAICLVLVKRVRRDAFPFCHPPCRKPRSTLALVEVPSTDSIHER